MRIGLRTGSIIAGYQLDRLLGRGGMGIVYLADEPALGRKVALKLLAPELGDDGEFRTRFLRESRLAASLDHPNVVPVYRAGEEDGLLYLAMRYVEGEDLAARLKRERRLSPERTREIVSAVAGALDAAHARGLVHRDVKPGNVLLAEEHVYLSDFGLTKGGDDSRALTTSGMFVGTVDYVSPEQIEGRPLDGRADQYSLACLAFHCLSGSVPFPRSQDLAVLYAHLSVPPPRVEEKCPQLSTVAGDVIASALAKDPNERFETCRAFAAALSEALTGSESASTVLQPPIPAHRELPTGTLTLLFSDLEGSTRLVRDLKERYVKVLAQYRSILTNVSAAAGGREVDTQGDSSFIVFARATEAVRTAVEAQRALRAHSWPAGTEVKARMGIHTGTPLLSTQGYVGEEVNAAARIMAAAHGGQVVVSEQTHALLADSLPEGITLRNLGEHRLKDLTGPKRLYQVVADGLPSDFPPPPTLDSRPTNLPTQPTRLVGRTQELEELVALLGRDHVRLVTLTGPGGSGKTRLALHAAAELIERYAGGVWFVGLVALSDASLVVPTIAQTLAVKEQAGEATIDTLAASIGDKEILLLLDNFEHVVEAGPQLAELLARAPRLKALVTSRASLHVRVEHEYAIPPLGEDEAVALFAERARAAKAAFSLDRSRSVVADICRRLDGLPLAIELAAARIKVLSEQALLERLDEKLRLLTSGARDADERQRTLRAAIDWSHDLLSEEERTLFRRLAVFAGGITLEAVEAVCNPADELDILEGITSLIDKSLLRREDVGADARFVMLETLADYAREKLEERGEAVEVGRRHAEYFLALAEQATAEFQGPHEFEWFARLEAEVANLRAAIAFFERVDDVAAALQLAYATTPFWLVRGSLEEQYARLDRLLEGGADVPTRLRAGALARRSDFARRLGNLKRGVSDAALATAMARELGDESLIARCLLSEGSARREAGDATAGEAAYEAALAVARAPGEARLRALAVLNLGAVALDRGDWSRAEKRSEEAIELARGLENERGVAVAAFNVAFSRIMAGRPEDARAPLAEAITICRRFGWQEVLVASAQLVAAVQAEMGAPLLAAQLLAAAERERSAMGLALEDAERRLHDQTVASLRHELGEAALEAAWVAGEGRPIEELLDWTS